MLLEAFIFNGNALFQRIWRFVYPCHTDRYIPAVLEAVKKVPEWNDAAWLLRYQIMTMTETFKRLL